MSLAACKKVKVAAVASGKLELNPQMLWWNQRLRPFCPFDDADGSIAPQKLVQPQRQRLFSATEPVQVDVMESCCIFVAIILANKNVAWADEVLPGAPTAPDALGKARLP